MDISVLQNTLFSHETSIKDGAEVFGILGNECRLEMLLALLITPEMSSGDIALATNCTPSLVSQSLSMMKRTRLVETRRKGLRIYYSLNYYHPHIQSLLPLLSSLLK